MTFIGITISAEGNTWKAVTDPDAPHIVCGNTDYGFILTFEGDGWEGENRYIRLVATTLEGDGTVYAIGARDTDYVLLFEPIEKACVLQVYITRGDRKTTIPAVVQCDECITDNSGIEDEPRPDIYNLMMEYVAQRRQGSQSAADALLSTLYGLREGVAPAYPGDDYRRTAKRSERVTTVSGTLKLATGRTLAVTDDMISSNSLKLAAETISSDALIPGGVPSTELNAELRLTDIEPGDLYEARLTLKYRIQRHDEHWCEIDLGAFTITEAKAPKPGYAQITAYDDMLKFTRLSRSAFPFTQKTYYTFSEIVNGLASAAGVPWDGILPPYPQAGMGEWPKVKPAELNTGIETGRDLLGWIAQAVCTIAMIGPRDKKLHLVPIEKLDPVESYTEGDSLAHAVSNLGYRLYAIKTTIQTESAYTDGTTGPEVWTDYTLWPSGVTAEMPENLALDAMYYVFPGARNPEQRAGPNFGIAKTLDPVIFTPGEVEHYGDPALRLLEWIEVRTEAGDAQFPITRTEWTYRGPHKVESRGMESVAGLEKTMAEKRNLGARIKSWKDEENGIRGMMLMFIQTDGHAGMAEYTHNQLHHFTHRELGTRGEY